MFSLFQKKADPQAELKKKLSGFRKREIIYEFVDLQELADGMKSNKRYLLSLTPANYYALKPHFLKASVFTNEDMSENWIAFQAAEYKNGIERFNQKTELFSVDSEIMQTAFYKARIMT